MLKNIGKALLVAGWVWQVGFPAPAPLHVHFVNGPVGYTEPSREACEVERFKEDTLVGLICHNPITPADVADCALRATAISESNCIKSEDALPDQ